MFQDFAPFLQGQANPLSTNIASPGSDTIEALTEAAFVRMNEKMENPADLQELAAVMMEGYLAYQQILALEQDHHRSLEKLSEKLLREVHELGANSAKIIARINAGEEVETEFGDFDESSFEEREIGSSLDEEIDKRRLINMLIQGGALETETIYLLGQQELDAISPALVPAYRALSASAELGYWMLSTDMYQSLQVEEDYMPLAAGAQAGGEAASMQVQGGKVELDFSTKPVSIKASAQCFSVLCQELGKGVLELVTLPGLPADKNIREQVLRATDRPEYEIWDIRLGPQLWKSFREASGSLSGYERCKALRNLVSLPASRFLLVMRDIISGDDKAQQLFQE